MPQWLTTFTSSILPSLIVGVATARFSVWLAIRRFQSERWWERKAEAYSRIIEALHDATECFSAWSHEDETGERISEDHKKELEEVYGRARRELRKAKGIGAYIISDEVTQVLATLEKRPRLDEKECAFFELYDAEFEAYKKALADVRLLARKDLRV
jgi:hypothetical protein